MCAKRCEDEHGLFQQAAVPWAGARATGIADYFSAIVSVEEVGASKREPAVYDRAREAMGTERALTWGFEDALYAMDTPL